MNNQLLTIQQVMQQTADIGNQLAALNTRAQTALAAVATHNAQPGAPQLDLMPLTIITRGTLQIGSAAANHQTVNCKRLAAANAPAPAHAAPAPAPVKAAPVAASAAPAPAKPVTAPVAVKPVTTPVVQATAPPAAKNGTGTVPPPSAAPAAPAAK